MMIKTFNDFESIRLQPKLHTEDHKLVDYPEWPMFERLAETRPVRAIWLLVIVFIYYQLDAPAWAFLLVPLHIAIGPIQGAIVNWFGHKHGYTNFELSDGSRNTLPVDLLLMGELYQNNHHRFPKSTNFAYKWFELDPTYYIIEVLSFIGIISKDQKSVAKVPASS